MNVFNTSSEKKPEDQKYLLQIIHLRVEVHYQNPWHNLSFPWTHQWSWVSSRDSGDL